MKPIRLIAALVVLAALGGYAWWSNKNPSAPKTDTTAQPVMVTLKPDDVQSIAYTKSSAAVYTLTRAGSGWQVSSPDLAAKPLAADSDAVTPETTMLNPMNSSRLVDEHPASLATFGLDTPTSEVDVKTKDGKSIKVLFGSETPTTGSFYAKLADSPKVYTVLASTASAFDKSVNDLRDKKLLAIDPDQVSSLSLTAKNQTIEMQRNAAKEWEITKPKPQRADSIAVDELLGALRDVKMIPDDSSKADAESYASGTKVASVTVADKNGAQTIEVHKSKDDYFAKSSHVEGIYKVSADVGKALDKSADDFRNKKLFTFGFTDPSKMNLAGKQYEKSGNKWFSGSAQLDSPSVQDVIDKLRDLAASKFADKISGTQALVISITWGDKNSVDKVVFNKSGDSYLASRDGDPTVYGVDAAAFDDLQKTIAAIKPAAAATPAKK